MAPRKKKLSREEILERKREVERRRYQRLKNDPQKREELREKERLKYIKKKEIGKRKVVADMTPREHREAKKKWKEHCSTYRNKKKHLKNSTEIYIRENTPDSDVSNSHQIPPDVAQVVMKIKNQQKQLRHKLKKQKDKEIEGLKRKILRYKQRLYRKKPNKKPDTPNSKIKKLADTPESKKVLVKKALFGEIIKEQLKENFSRMKTLREKRFMTKVVTGRLVDKYKLWRMEKAGVMSYKRIKMAKITKDLKKKTKISKGCVKAVVNFYEDDSNSRLGAGKKEFITRNKERKQKRYMLDSVLRLHKKFLQNSNFKLSYQTFCRLRPFWVVTPKVDERDTCLCIAHANIDLKLSALHNRRILNYNGHQKLLEELCCDRYNVRCLSRECHKCFNHSPSYKEFNDEIPITYMKWVAEKHDYTDPKTTKIRRVMKYIKKPCIVSPRNLITQLHDELDVFFKHERNIVHQFNAIKDLKKSLTETDALIHMDFSENYCTKYGEEIQAFHFGGSRTQLSLHTVVVYGKNNTKSYCTVSTNVSHSPSAIWAHLQPIFQALPKEIENLHFLSDGPVTQYRNKTMFYIVATKLPEAMPNVKRFTWNYTESGHGKGAPDGVGATCKRTADAVVAGGGDIENLDKFVDAIEQRCPAITLIVIQDDAITKMSAEIQQEVTKIKNFVGTLKVHQVTGLFKNPSGFKLNSIELLMKHLSCFCKNDDCPHFNIGKIAYENKTKLMVDEVFTDSESETEAGPSSLPAQAAYNRGDYILVKYLVRNTEYRYVSVIDKIDEEDGDITVTFMKLYDSKGQTFRFDQDDVADIAIEQVIKKLPSPNLILKGNRVFYKFEFPIDVFEKR